MISTDTRVLITGGSGFIGSNMVETLVSRNIPIVNVDFNEPPIDSHLKYWENINILDKKRLQDVILEFLPTHILHLAATTGMGEYPQDYFLTNTEGVQNIVDVSNKLTSLKKAMFTSTLLVCKRDRIPRWDTDYSADTQYGQSKVEGELIVRNSSSNFPWFIVRPTAVWGPLFKHSYKTFFKMINKGFYLNPGFKPIGKPISYVGNTVYMMLSLLLSSDQSINKQTFYLADYPGYTIQEWAQTIHTQLFNSGKIKSLPISIMKAMALTGDLLQISGYKDPPITSFRLSNMLTGGLVNIDNTKLYVKELPFNLNDGTCKTIDWLKEVGEI